MEEALVSITPVLVVGLSILIMVSFWAFTEIHFLKKDIKRIEDAYVRKCTVDYLERDIHMIHSNYVKDWQLEYLKKDIQFLQKQFREPKDSKD